MPRRKRRVEAGGIGIVGSAVTLYINWPLIQTFKGARAIFRNNELILAIGPIAIALIIPLATIILVNRKIAPTARARFRTKPTAPKTPA